ncbi:MAG: hypothetical protein RL557_838 [archaeon]|jgi:hypothetical protein
MGTNSVIYNYLKQYSSLYPIEDLHKKIISKGYSEKEFEDALAQLREESSSRLNTPTRSLSSSEQPLRKKGSSLMFKLAGIAGILTLLLIVFSFFTEGIVTPLSILLSLLFSVLFFLGFIYLGRRYDRLLIQFASWFFIIVSLALFLLYITLQFRADLITLPSFDATSFVANPTEAFQSLGITMVSAVIGTLVLVIAFGILLGVGFLRLHDAVPLARTVGIITIIGFCTMVFIVGLFFLFIAFLLQIVLLLKE